MGRAFEYRRAAKEKRWDKMSKLFPKLAKAITMAVREGGPDPEANSQLRTAIINAKAENMPKDNIEAAIKRASGKDGTGIVEVHYEGKAPHGVMLFVECASDNTNRTVANLKTCLNKAGGQLVPTGSIEYLFSRKAVVDFAVRDELDMDEVELSLIDAGLEELEVVDGVASAYGDYKDFRRMCDAVEALGIEIARATLRRVPASTVELSEAEMEEVERLIDRIEDDEDVQGVFSNIA